MLLAGLRVESSGLVTMASQLTRSFRALKAWMMLKAHGTEKFGRIIQQNVEQARYLASLVDASPELERLLLLRSTSSASAIWATGAAFPMKR